MFLQSSEGYTQSWLNSVLDCTNKLTENKYVFSHDQLDCQQGIAKLDCSGFVNAILINYFPETNVQLRNFTAGKRPNTKDFYNFILNSNAKSLIKKVSSIDKLRAGDLVVIKYSQEHIERVNTRSKGHIMIVLDSFKVSTIDNIYQVKVIDSAISGHANDTRQQGETGIGVGSIFIEVDTAGGPIAYDWSGRGNYNSSNEIIFGSL